MSAATPIIVRSQAELQQYLWDPPIQLRAARPDRGPRVGHPAFIGPVAPPVWAQKDPCLVLQTCRDRYRQILADCHLEARRGRRLDRHGSEKSGQWR